MLSELIDRVYHKSMVHSSIKTDIIGLRGSRDQFGTSQSCEEFLDVIFDGELRLDLFIDLSTLKAVLLCFKCYCNDDDSEDDSEWPSEASNDHEEACR